MDQNGVSHLGFLPAPFLWVTLELIHVLSLRPALGALRVLQYPVAAHYPVCRSFRRLWRLVSSGVGQCRPGGNTDLELQGLSWFSDSLVPWFSSVAAGAGFGWPCFTAPHSCRPLSMCRLARCPSESCNRTSNRLKMGCRIPAGKRCRDSIASRRGSATTWISSYGRKPPRPSCMRWSHNTGSSWATWYGAAGASPVRQSGLAWRHRMAARFAQQRVPPRDGRPNPGSIR